MAEKKIENISPLSPIQRGLLFHALLEPETGAYYQRLSAPMAGLDPAAFRAAWEQVARRHGVLRTAFVWEKRNDPLQVVFRDPELPWTELDWRGLDAAEQARRLDALLDEDRRRGFDFARAPLMRFHVIRMADRRHHFVWSSHHILFDGMSMLVVSREVGALYEAALQGRRAQLPPARPYTEYVSWLRRQDPAAAEGFWRRFLAGVSAPTSFGVDRAAAAAGDGDAFGEVELRLTLAQTARLQAAARRHRLTESVLVQAAWARLLAVYSGGGDVTFGVTVFGRPAELPGSESMVGLFINALPFRVRAEPDQALGPWLAGIQGAQSEMRQHEASSLVDVQGWSDVPRGTPLFESLLSLGFTGDAASAEAGAEDAAADQSDTFQRAHYPLTISAQATPFLFLKLAFDGRRFTRDAVERMAAHLRRLLLAIVERMDDAGATVGGLSLLDADETAQLLAGFNDTALSVDADGFRPVHTLVEARAAESPDALALADSSRSLTYAELNREANRIAHHLRALGIAPEARVGICLPRSAEMFVAALAILKAGAAYVPLDPEYPADRLRFMAGDAGLQLLITSPTLRDRFDADAGVPAIDFDALASAAATLDDAADQNPGIEVSPESLAYVIYTSGSTGTPKGVMVPHRGLRNLVAWHQHAYSLSADDRTTQIAGPGFDAAVWEVWPTLAAGAALLVAPERVRLDAPELVRWLADERVSICFLPTPLAEAALEQAWPADVALRAMLTGGDRLHRGAPADLPFRLINHYGPSESSVVATGGDVSESTDGITPSIGRPIANTRVYVLDAQMQPVPLGVVGELYIAGTSLARGYLDRPGLTAERFVPDAFSGDAGGRLYRTGDLVRWRADGEIDFVRRADDQVKIRGFRIELGEIEAVLAQHASVRGAAVVVHGAEGQRRLVAYVAASEDERDAEPLRAHLRERLPDYMVPAAFVWMDALPVTANGKTDRRALPEPVEDEGQAAARVVPRNATEELLAGIWSEVLGVERPGVHDGFFDLGGHSLLATQVVSRIQRVCGVDVPLRTLFTTPTIAALALEVDRLRAGDGAAAAPPIVPVPRDGPLPLSFAQQRLWFLDRLEPGAASYNIPAAVRLRGALDVDALRGALGQVVRRHEALRTTFRVADDGEPYQHIAEAAEAPFEVADFRALAPHAAEAEAIALLRERAGAPFDLAAGPLFRATLAHVEPGDALLLLTMHHAVSDGWSMGVLLGELTALYSAAVEGRANPLPPLAVQYADFAAWQRGWLSGDVLDAQLAYWRGALAGAPAVLDLPTDRARPATRDGLGAVHSFALSADLSARLNRLARAEGATLYMTLLAAFQTLLHRYSGQDDISVGSPIAGRNRAETEALIGFFVNTLVLRTRFGGNPAFRDVLKAVRETTLGAYAHQDLPFEQMVEELKPERSLSHTPLFQVLFSLQNNPDGGTAQLAGLTMEGVELDGATAKFDLTLAMAEGPDGLVASLEYATDVFDAPTIARMAGHLERLLDAVAADPAARVGTLPLLSAAEHDAILGAWSVEGPDFAARDADSRSTTVARRFEAQVRRSPDSVALVCRDESLTYDELNRRANRVAHLLRSLGVREESRVGLCTERSLDFIVGILGTLKAGGAYVPLEPTYPAERLAWMIDDASVDVVITRAGGMEVLPETVRTVELSGSAEALIAQQSDENPTPVGDAESIVYVPYTSGSTGVPKGMEVPNRAVPGVTTDVSWARFGPHQTVFQHSAISWDICALEIWASLLCGGRCVLHPDRFAGIDDVRRAIREQGVTVMWLTSSVFTLVMETDPTVLEGLDQLMAGGEAVSLPHVKQLQALYPDMPFTNGYGPCEATIFTTCYPVPQVLDERLASLPIGRPIGDRRVYVLDSRLQPVPVGVAGELYVGGAAIARHYVNRPALTAEKFVPDPYAVVPGERMYGTGDRTRWRADGTLEYLGRVDHQVKLRGFRIELGEIESAVAKHPSVREAAVVVRGEGTGRRLVAYVVADGDASPADRDALRTDLAAHLPEYMVPSAFVWMDAMPLGPTGKTDRKALPEPDAAAVQAGEYVAPRNATEELLAGIWAEVLRVERVGVHDGFFDLGGHSLLATQVMSRIQRVCGVEVPLRAIFATPTVAGLAAEVERIRSTEGAGAAPAIVPVSRDRPLPLSFAQQRLWFIDQLEPGSASYNIPMALRLRGALDVDALRDALREVVRRHEVLRTTFRMMDGAPAQFVDASAEPAFDVVDARGGEAEALTIVRARAAAPFDLAAGPLFRATLVRVADGDAMLLLVMHHAVSDGWSTGVLFGELATLYTAFAEGRPSPLPELAVQYGDFSAWQREWLRGDVLQAQLAYWRNALGGAPAVLSLPTDRPRPATRDGLGAVHSFALSPELSAALNRLARAEGATLYMTLLAAFQTLLHRYSGQDDISVGSPIAGRNRAETEALIGFFVNTLVLRTRFPGNPAFRDVLRTVRETTLGAYAHQDLPFEQMVEELKPERSLSHAPLFQAMFTLQNAPADTGASLPGLVLEGVELEGATAKFDLSLSMGEGPDGLVASLEYATDIFDAPTIARIAGHFQRLLAAVVSDPSARVGNLPILTEPEHTAILGAWSVEGPDFAARDADSRSTTVAQRFEAQVRRSPDAVALVCRDESLTYDELNRRANRVAHLLRSMGVREESRVGLCTERSLDFIVGILGTLKAGGAYVPLEPTYPAERLAWMVADASADVVITRAGGVQVLPETVRTVELSGSAEALIAQQSDENPEPVGDAESIVYVPYTSGSTGVPKGMEVPNRAVPGVTTDVSWARFGPHQTVFQHSAISWDICALEIWASLLCGARCVLHPERFAGIDDVRRAIREQGVTVMWLTSSVFTLVMETDPSVLEGLDQLMAGGEAVSLPHVKQLKALYPEMPFTNGYGPCEATIFSTCYPVPDVLDESLSTLPIGRPIGDRRVYVLDSRLQPVPVGVAGELYVGGAAIARHYVNRPGLSAEKFLPDPYAVVPGERMYATGDLSRWRADGTIEYLGRVDHQVKLRGFRIELGEIESAVASHPAVDAAAVVIRGEGAGKRLVAYVVADPNAPEGDRDELRGYLSARLPEYMVPSAFVWMDAMPLSPNGKTDRKALPEPDAVAVEVGTYVAPRNATEELLAGIWAEVLRVEKVGVHDGFFDLGGHSLLATQVVSRIQRVCGVEVPLRAIFATPTVAGLAAEVERIRSTDGAGAAPAVVPVPRDRPLPLSFAQQRLWFLDRLLPGSASYNIPAAVRLTGTLDVDALHGAVREIVRRHEVLRTTLQLVDGEPAQVVDAQADAAFEVVDVRGSAEVEAEAASIAAERVGTGFDLAAGPLFRTTLVRVADDDAILLMVMHHAVSDGWSMGVLFGELAALYTAFARGEPSPLPELAVQYGDFAAWQRGWLSGDVLEAQLAHWRTALAGLPPVLELPSDRPRPATRGGAGASLSFAVSAELTAGLNRLARKEGATLYMTLLAAFQTLLYRYTGQDDIAVGSPIAGRNRAETEALIGFFVNTLVLRARLDGNPAFRDVLRAVRETTLGAYAHQDLPFEQLVEELRPERSLSHTPLFQAMFSLQNNPGGTGTLPGLEMAGVDLDGSTAKFDLSLSMGEGPDGLVASIAYPTDIFDAPTIERMAGHFARLLAAVVAEPGARIGDLPLLAADEEQSILGWTASAPAAPAESPAFHAVFERRAAASPDALAIHDGARRITYGELDRGANRLAHRLRALGVDADVRVGLCLDRSAEMVLAILAVLKAGGAYVPLDPKYPAERLRFMAQDSDIRLLIARGDSGASVDVGGSVEMLDLDALLDEAAALDASAELNPAVEVSADSLAYVIYTSGSTGTPKGVMVAHGGLVNLAAALSEAYGLREGSRILQFASFSFDASVSELAMAWTSGSSLHIAPRESLLGGDVAGLVAERGIDVLKVPPSVLAVLSPDELPGVETVIVGSEACMPELVARWAPGRRFFNVYGPTEATANSTVARIESADRAPIGRPIAGTRAYVLDARLQPVPVGVAGELYVGGAGIVRGYHGRAALTAERFIPDPFSAEGGARLYRTGDVVRWRVDGQIEFVGRADDQVKIRGFRIELGEIENVLASHPAIADAVVTVRGTGDGKQLVAYAVTRAEVEAPTRDELRGYLRERLPEHMVPAAWVMMDALPLGPTGKVDRKALPAPDAGPAAAAEYVAPRNATEELLAGIWTEVLAVERVGVHDSFFDLGGHSLLATRVMSRIHRVCGVDVPLRALFATPTIAGLAAEVERLRAEGGAGVAPTIVPLPRDRPLPLSFAQQRLWFLDRLEPGAAYNLPSALRLKGALDAGALHRALAEIVRRHEVLRSVFREVDGEPVQVALDDAGAWFESVDLRAAADAEAEARAVVEDRASRPFDLAAGPLFRATLVHVADEDAILLLVMHHAVSDGWSMGVLFGELAALYAAFTRGEPSPLPELAVQYADFAAWQRGWLAGEVLEAQLAYWRNALGGAPAVLSLPTDRPRPAVRRGGGATRTFALPRELSAALNRLARAEGATLYMTLLAAFQTLLHRYSGQDDVSVGSPIAGRNRAETEALIGFFVNTLVLRTQFPGNPAFRDVLAAVRETTLAAYAHQDLPFERLVEELKPERSLSHAPLFQAMFTLQNAGGAAGGSPFPGLALEGVEMDAATAKFDLSLSMGEGPDGLVGALEYATDIFDEPTISRMVGHFERLLDAIAADPSARVGNLPMLTQPEHDAILGAWSVEGPDFAARDADSRSTTVAQRFEAQVRRSPDSIALVCRDESLTYDELNRRANRLAHLLRSMGVREESRVGLCTERSLDFIVGILGTLKAGGAYVPLEPTYPAERLAWMVADASADVVITRAGGVQVLPSSVRTVELSGSAEALIAQQSDENPTPVGDAESIVYVPYTSGSTGVPKGMEVPNRAVPGVTTDVSWARFGPHQTVFQHSAISWDICALEIWASLLCGARCVLHPERFAGIDDVRRAIREQGVTVMWLTSSVFTLVMETDPSVLEGLDQLMAGGEAVSLPHVRQLQALYPDMPFTNGYGPCEATIFTTCYPVPRVLDESLSTLPIGRPIGDRRVYVLDSRLQPVPVGVAGELYVGGAAIARHYVNRPGLSAEKFLPDPYAIIPGERMYATGDLSRWRADGTIEYLGRVDHQVKLRGFRIELGEIESAVASHPAVDAAAVVIRGEGAGKRLVAYVVADPNAPEADRDELRGYLAARLPEYMVPSAFVWMDAMPLSPNGKTDRKALPEPDAVAVDAGAYVAPRNAAEELLAGIWAEVLRVEKVSVHDGFFDLGGHSLLATQVVSRIQRVCGVEVPLRAIFATPTVAGLAVEVERIRSTDGAGAAPAIVPVPRDRPLPLSFAQQRLWFLDRLRPGSASYNVPSALRLEGALNVDALHGALRETVRRHEVLRTVFQLVDGEPAQVVDAHGDVAFEVVDLRSLASADAARARAMELARDHARQPFDLAAGPLFRATLLRVADDDAILLMVMHHAVSDGWSMGLLFGELAALYSAFAQGAPSPLPELGIQYGDFAAWQRGWLTGDVLDAQLAYWRGTLAGAAPVLELPTDRPRPAIRRGEGAAHAFTLPPELSAAVGRLARKEGATLYMTLLAAYQVLLHRYSGEDDVSVGSPIAGRNRAETEGLIGFFVNTLVLRARFDGNPAFRDVLRDVRETTLGAYAHQDLPFEQLVEELRPERSLSHTPVFQVMFSLQNAPTGIGEPLAGITLSGVPLEGSSAKFDLSLSIGEGPDGLAATLAYPTDIFDAPTIERMAGHFARLLAAVAADPATGVADVPLLAADEADALLGWSAAPAPESNHEAAFHAVFERRAAISPDALAIHDGPRRITYGELDRAANRLAHRLRALGVGTDVRVGLCLDRSAEMVLAILAVLKAGGAYVPLDPKYPAERLRFMAEDSGIRLLIARGDSGASVDVGGSVDVFDLDALLDEAAALDASAESKPAIEVSADSLAYVIYTSGSTGTPKGVMVPHGGLVNLAAALANAYELREGSRILQFASFSFDASVSELAMAWTSGSSLHIAPRESLLGGDLAGLVAERGIDVLKVPPSVLAVLSPDELPGVETVIVGSEACTPDLVARWAPGRRFFNVYGPTEATANSTVARIESVDRAPIGQPIAGTRAYVLDARLQPVPVGVAGELYVGGAGIVRGYHGRPGLTAERFVPDPFSSTHGARLYRTGDVVRWRVDGQIEFVGRADDQVKIRGFRIELGEIENVLASHPSIADAVVTVRGTGDGKQLVAYAVARPESEAPTRDELRTYLRERMPEHMVPAAWVMMDALPLGPTGKVDRKALPEPARAGSEREHVAPRTATETALVDAWAAVLDVERVGIDDGFFELGGHSLLALKLSARVEERLGRPLPLAALFQHPTPRALAQALGSSAVADAAPFSPLVRMREGGGAPLFLVHPVGGNVLCYAGLAARLPADHAVYGLQSPGLGGGAVEGATVESLAAEYLAHVRQVQPAGPYHLGGWSIGGVIAFEMARQLRDAGAEVATLALLDTAPPAPTPWPAAMEEAGLLASFAFDLLGASTDALGVPFGRFVEMEPAEAFRTVLAAARRAGVARGKAELRRLLDVFKANVRANRAYRPGPVDAPVLYFQASHTPAAAASTDGDGGFAARWAGLTPRLRTVELAGTHYDVLRGPQLETVARTLAHALAQPAAAGRARHTPILAASVDD